MNVQRTPVQGLDLSTLTEVHVGKWVALSPDYKKLLAVGATLSSVLEQVPREEKVVLQVLPKLGYAPFVQ